MSFDPADLPDEIAECALMRALDTLAERELREGPRSAVEDLAHLLPSEHPFAEATLIAAGKTILDQVVGAYPDVGAGNIAAFCAIRGAILGAQAQALLEAGTLVPDAPPSP